MKDCPSMEDSVTQSFKKYNETLTQESAVKEEIRTAVRDLEEQARNLLNILQAAHHPNGVFQEVETSSKCSDLLQVTGPMIQKLATKFDPLCYYKYHDQWRFTIQKLVFVVLFVGFMNSEDSADVTDSTNTIPDKPATADDDDNTTGHGGGGGDDDVDKEGKVFFMKHEECAQVLGLKTRAEEGFHLEVEDYLNGLLMLSSELARLSTNAVTAGNYHLPLRIGRFVAKLDQGFRLLNLKNDQLRRRYDGLKYDLKRVEEIAYDLSIRGLK